MTKSKAWGWTKSPWAKRLFSFSRWLHIYLSTGLLALLLFFCLTGFTLNHADWFSSMATSGVDSFAIPNFLQEELERSDKQLSTAVIEQYLKATFGLESPRSLDVDLETGEVGLDYPLPAGYAFVTLLPQDQLIEVEYQRGTLVALLNDLHKGRHSGAFWSLLLDISAVMIALFSLAGLVILLQHRNNRRAGLISVTLGLITPLLVVLLAVPSY